MSLAVRMFRSDRSSVLLVLTLALLLFATQLGGRDFWNPDEPRSALLIENILRDGSWAVLRVDEASYVEKPPLYFWMAALFSLPAGRVTEFSARLPSSAAAILGMIVVFYLGRGLYGRRTGVLAAVVLATSQDYFLEGRWAHPDMLFCCLLTAACFAFHGAFRRDWERGWLLGFYGATGAALLTKGPAGLLPLVAAIVFLAATRRLSALPRIGLAWGLPLTLLPTALWLAAYQAAADAPFPLADVLQRLIARVTEGVHHPRPFIHILTSLPIAFLHWSLLLPGAVVHTFPRRWARDDEMVYLYSFLTVYIAVFAFSAEKRGVYLLPLLPLLALLIGRIWDIALLDWDPSPVDRTVSWGLWAGVALAVGAAVYVPGQAGMEAPVLLFPALLLGGTAILTALSAALAHRRYGGGTALAVLSGGLVVCYLAVVTVVLPAIDPIKSARPFSRRVAAEVGAAPLAIYPDLLPAYAFYSGRRIEVIRQSRDLERFLNSAPRTFCLMEQGRYEGERSRLWASTQVVDRARVGHRVILLIGGGSEPDVAAGDPG